MRHFNSFQEAFDDLKTTTYEKEQGIELKKERGILFDSIDIKVVWIKKSTGEKGIYFIYKTSKKYDMWITWCPSGNQQKVLPEIAKILKEVDSHNINFWIKENENNTN